MGELIDKLMERWGVETIGGLLLILFIFSITGMTALYVRKLVFGWLGFSSQTPLVVEILAWVLVVFPSYQILFLFFGFILGQFEFVWNFEKKSLHRIKSLFVRENR
ncbi:hypothetical protein LX73_1008 [Fodinibius salinus]|uniref:DUF6787 domain-containing protein n=1 Tax=Fodinibius salinus TaxID=860790 RepID=A0A5D3YII6_9BACT|nr:DUF6787 family protein [Fodinibius salinus]TYP93308.1 hypothetical protein LX73_1008 [Fodinibius salinus]